SPSAITSNGLQTPLVIQWSVQRSSSLLVASAPLWTTPRARQLRARLALNLSSAKTYGNKSLASSRVTDAKHLKINAGRLTSRKGRLAFLIRLAQLRVSSLKDLRTQVHGRRKAQLFRCRGFRMKWNISCTNRSFPIFKNGITWTRSSRSVCCIARGLAKG